VIWLPVGVAMVAVPAWLGGTRWRLLLHGHPLLPALALLSALVGIVAVAWAIGTLVLADRIDREHRPHWTHAQLLRRARIRLFTGVPALLLSTALLAVVAWARPIAADDRAIRATRSSDSVHVADRLTWLELVPTRTDADDDAVQPTTGLVFLPATRVDARGYANLLRPLSEAGYLVAILKDPLGLSLLQPGHAQTVLDVHPEIANWAVGGHAAGAITAADFADHSTRVAALVLYAAAPDRRLQRTQLRVLSVSGSADALTTPESVAAARANLPLGTQHVVIEGAVHSFFGDYGDQPGDGPPTVTREQAQEQTRAATAAFLARLAPRKK